MITQSKGKDLEKVPKSKLEDIFYAGIKYDGHYVQISKIGNTVRFFTSGGKEFYIDHIADELIVNNPDVDFTIEAEYIANTDGKLGCRGKAAKLTTYRTNFEKGISNTCIPGNDIFKAFDCITYKDLFDGAHYGVNEESVMFSIRRNMLHKLKLGTHIEPVPMTKVNLCKAKEEAKYAVKDGFEGLYLKSPTHRYFEGKRVNNAIKLKLRPTADLLCIDYEEGTGKYEGMIGSLVLVDSKKRIVRVGSGLSDADRAKPFIAFNNEIIEISYEQILDTYIQPTFVAVRFDKEEMD